MAIWQYTVFLLPKKEVNKKFGNLCKRVEESFLENFVGWNTYPQEAVHQLLVKNFGPPQITYCDSILFGNDAGSCVNLIVKDNALEDVTIRLDLREPVKLHIEAILHLSDLLDGIFVSPEFEVFKCDKETLVNSIKKSDALRFVKSPQKFFDSLSIKNSKG